MRRKGQREQGEALLTRVKQTLGDLEQALTGEQ
jgi:hypothetical protein